MFQRLSGVRRTLFVFAALLSSALPGCGSGAPKANVAGTVTINGNSPKGKVSLSFLGSDGLPRATESGDSGRFSLTGLPTGDVTVVVGEVSERGSEDAPGVGRRAELAKTKEKRPVLHLKTGTGEVPSAYSDASKPLLRYTLTPGDNTLTVELKSPVPK